MSNKEATIIAYALQHLLSTWDYNIEASLEGIAIDKDIEFLVGKYESTSRKLVAYEL